MQRNEISPAGLAGFCSILAVAVPTVFSVDTARAEQPPAPCHPNPNATADSAAVAGRGDVVNLPQELKDRLVRLADRPHTYLPLQVFAEADDPSQLFQYYLLDSTGFEPNVFTTIFPGVNDHVQLTATGGNCGLPSIGAVRVVLEPKPGLPTDPTKPRAFIDVFTDISPLFVINNESGWYEGWMIHDITVPIVAAPRKGSFAPVDEPFFRVPGHQHIDLEWEFEAGEGIPSKPTLARDGVTGNPLISLYLLIPSGRQS